MDTNRKFHKNRLQSLARLAGVLYLLIFIIGFYGVFVRSQLVVSGDFTATARNIMDSQSEWRTGLGADLVMQILDVPVMLILFLLLRPVNKNLALFALLFNLIQTAVLVVNKVNLVKVLLLLGNGDYLKAFGAPHLYAQTYLAIQSYDYEFGIGLVFFGFASLVYGYLIFKSGFLPKAIGVLMQIAGLCYLTNSFALLLAPEVAKIIFPEIMVPIVIGELSLCLWLMIKGVKVTVWFDKAENLQGKYF